MIKISKIIPLISVVSLASFLLVVPLGVRGYEIVQLSGVPVSNDFLVTPAIEQIIVEPNTSNSFTLGILNRTGGERTFLISLEDFALSPDESEYVKFLGDSGLPNSVIDFVNLQADRITLAHGEIVNLPISITISENESLPARYGAVVVSLEQNANVTGNANLSTRIAVPILLATSHTVQSEGEVLDFRTISGSKFLHQVPVELSVTYRNTGSVHSSIDGRIVFTNVLGKEIEKIVIDNWFVLPGSTRTRTFAIDEERLFGPYSVSLFLDDGSSISTSDTRVIKIWVLPWPSLLVLGVALGLIITVFLKLRRRLI